MTRQGRRGAQAADMGLRPPSGWAMARKAECGSMYMTRLQDSHPVRPGDTALRLTALWGVVAVTHLFADEDNDPGQAT